MNKQEFLDHLQKGLSGLPQDDVAERLTFYTEMIDDRMEDGLTEEDAVSAVGTVDEIVSQIAAELSPAKRDKTQSKPKRRLKTWEVALLALGSPVWFPLLLTAFSVFLALYISMWSVIISLWAVFSCLLGCAFGGLATGLVSVCCGNTITAAAILGAGSICGGLSIFMFYGCKAVTKGVVMLTKKLAIWTRGCFVKKEGV